MQQLYLHKGKGKARLLNRHDRQALWHLQGCIAELDKSIAELKARLTDGAGSQSHPGAQGSGGGWETARGGHSQER